MPQAIDELFAILAPYGAARETPMSSLTSFRIGGPAALFLEPKDRACLFLALEKARALSVPVTLMGNGTNLLVSDDGVAGLVVKLGPAFSKMEVETQTGRVTALAGALLSALANFAADQGLMGLEWAAGIPGSVGGALAMNAGAYGGEMKDALCALEYLDVGTGEVYCRPALAGELGYRASAFSWPARAVLSAVFSLAPDDGGMRARMQDYARRRRDKQPLSYPSAGSAFKRPKGHFAGALIEAAGLKGARVGGAMVSELHAGFIINTGDATCADVLALLDLVKTRVLATSGVELEPEIRLIGRNMP